VIYLKRLCRLDAQYLPEHYFNTSSFASQPLHHAKAHLFYAVRHARIWCFTQERVLFAPAALFPQRRPLKQIEPRRLYAQNL